MQFQQATNNTLNASHKTLTWSSRQAIVKCNENPLFSLGIIYLYLHTNTLFSQFISISLCFFLLLLILGKLQLSTNASQRFLFSSSVDLTTFDANDVNWQMQTFFYFCIFLNSSSTLWRMPIFCYSVNNKYKYI